MVARCGYYQSLALALTLGLLFIAAVPLLAGPEPRIAEAARNRDLAAVRSLLKSGADPNTPRSDGSTAIHWAARWDDLALAELLVAAGADVNRVNPYGVTALSLAAVNGSAGMAERLLAAGANPNLGHLSGETPLMNAARSGSVDTVRALATHGADLNAHEKVKGQTALMWAVAERHLEAARALIDLGADIHAKSASGSNALMFAARDGDIDLVKMLLGKGARVQETAADGATPLLIATIRGHVPLALFLLDHGADPNAAGTGYTALHWAAGRWETVHTHDYDVPTGEWSRLAGLPRAEKFELMKALVAHGANVNAKATRLPPRYGYSLFNSVGRYAVGGTPFHIAAVSADPEVMRFLAANGADPSIRGGANTTAIIAAAGRTMIPGETRVSEAEHLEAVKAAFDLGVDIAATNDDGWNAVHAAAYAGFDSIVRYLVERGVDVNLISKRGYTPLKVAEGYVFPNMVNIKTSTVDVLRALGGVSTPGPPPRVNEER
ncbi:MAG TPA: ankyrin repeat domain-containing protein [Vicinamibacterales bacterium]|jgi:ankyrin repeat protein|nr:ankyrin repeat domain-containing protein [Vicinamibacterales bacterium]